MATLSNTSHDDILSQDSRAPKKVAKNMPDIPVFSQDQIFKTPNDYHAFAFQKTSDQPQRRACFVQVEEGEVTDD